MLLPMKMRGDQPDYLHHPDHTSEYLGRFASYYLPADDALRIFERSVFSFSRICYWRSQLVPHASNFNSRISARCYKYCESLLSGTVVTGKLMLAVVKFGIIRASYFEVVEPSIGDVCVNSSDISDAANYR